MQLFPSQKLLEGITVEMSQIQRLSHQTCINARHIYYSLTGTLGFTALLQVRTATRYLIFKKSPCTAISDPGGIIDSSCLPSTELSTESESSIKGTLAHCRRVQSYISCRKKIIPAAGRKSAQSRSSYLRAAPLKSVKSQETKMQAPPRSYDQRLICQFMYIKLLARRHLSLDLIWRNIRTLLYTRFTTYNSILIQKPVNYFRSTKVPNYFTTIQLYIGLIAPLDRLL